MNRIKLRLHTLVKTAMTLWLVAAAAFQAGCGKSHQANATPQASLPPAQVQIQPVSASQQISTEEVMGTVRAKIRATLEAKVGGRIEQMPVLLGDSVKAGQLIARVDAAEIKARLDQAQASLEQAERDWKRSSSLLEGQAVTRSEHDAVESRFRVSQAALAEAEAMMRYLEVVAPFDGVVSKKWADVGDFATPGKALVEVEDPSALQLDADLPEAIAPSIERGTRLAVRVGTAEIAGQVSEIAPSADPSSRTLRVKVDLPQTPGVQPGQFARLLVPLGERMSLRVPDSAVVQRGQLEIVFVVTNQLAQMRLVRTGKQFGREVEILAGLSTGDVVVAGGAAALRDGQPVEVK